MKVESLAGGSMVSALGIFAGLIRLVQIAAADAAQAPRPTNTRRRSAA